MRWMLLFCLACTGGDATDATDEAPLADLLGIGISPRDPIVEAGEQVAFVTKAFYADTSSRDISAEVTWVSTDQRVATVDSQGRATALVPGTAGIIATDDRGVSTRVDLTVRGADDQPDSVRLSPRAVDLKVDHEVELAALATWPDGTTGNMASSCSWSVPEDNIATVSDRGVLTGIAEGRTTVSAMCGAQEVSGPVSVRPADAVLDLPDLVVEDMEVQVSGEQLIVLASVMNAGDGMSPLGFVDLFLDTPAAPTDADTFVETQLVDALAPGESTLALITLNDVAPGTHQAWLWADADGWIEEADDGNNQRGPQAFEIGGALGPQLEITTFDGLTDGDYTYYEIEVHNVGDQAATDFWVDLWYDPPTDPEVCEDGDDFVFVESLAAGDTYLWEPEVTDGGTWLSVLFVDSCDDVDESDEDDNIDYLIVEP